ncbi:MAG: thermosome subunit [Euryarchaeota archaeon]|nr:thermosome subunit [Euryarchaeota archaeon]
MMQGQPVFILKEGTQREQGKGAHRNNIAAARAISDTVRSTLGPKGMDKMMVDSMGDIVITNDGATILKELDVSHPAAKMMVEIAKVQDTESGDGTTTAVILAGELLKQAETLIEKNIHPTTVTAGYKLASERALKVLEEVSEKVDAEDARKLRAIANTAMMSKSVAGIREMLSDIAVRAVLAVAEKRGTRRRADLDNISIVKKHGGSTRDTQLVDGMIIDKEVVHASMPRLVTGARVLLLDAALEIKKTEIDAKITIGDPDSLQLFLAEEEAALRDMVGKVRDSGANVVICQKGIDELAQHHLAKAGIMAVRRAKKSDLEKLARATGGSIVSRIADISKGDLGKAGRVEERRIGSDPMTFVTECPSAKAVTVLVRGGTEHVVDEMDRSLHDALSVVSDVVEDGKAYTGAGAAAMEVALRLRDFAASVGGREQLAIDAYASAFEVLPRTLAENAGLDPIDLLIELRRAHKNKERNAGVNVFSGKVEDMAKLNVMEPLRVGRQAIKSATEAAIMVLRVDDVIAAKDVSKDAGKGAPGGSCPPGGCSPGMGMG